MVCASATHQRGSLIMPFVDCVLPVCPDSDASIAAAQQDVQQQLGSSGLSLLVNNAGVGLVAPAEFVPLDQWRQVLDVNLQGPLAVTQVWRSNLPAWPVRGPVPLFAARS
jgi:NAD(P)-dependent dehydrogenase (short-subunit alcohol dehydrogenase family)